MKPPDREEILNIFTNIFREELDNPRIQLKDTTTAADIAEWDSLTNILLVVAIERKFRVKFSTNEIQSFRNVGEMISAIMDKSSPQ